MGRLSCKKSRECLEKTSNVACIIPHDTKYFFFVFLCCKKLLINVSATRTSSINNVMMQSSVEFWCASCTCFYIARHLSRFVDQVAFPTLCRGWFPGQIMLNMRHIAGNSINMVTSSSACSLLHSGLLLGAYYSNLKMKKIFSFETSVRFQGTTRYYIPEDKTRHNQRCENLKSCTNIAKYSSNILHTKMAPILVSLFLCN
jgi:hypothetical protein